MWSVFAAIIAQAGPRLFDLDQTRVWATAVTILSPGYLRSLNERRCNRNPRHYSFLASRRPTAIIKFGASIPTPMWYFLLETAP